MSTSIIGDGTQLLGTCFQLADCAKLNLSYGFGRHAVLGTDRLERVGLPVIVEVIALHHDIALAFLEYGKDFKDAAPRILLHELILRVIGRVGDQVF